MRAEKQNYDFHDVDTAQSIARDGRSGTLELERAAQVLDGEVDRLGTELDAIRAREAELNDTIDAAHGLICNAHRKRVDDVTEDDGASPGWAAAARRWIDAYPPAR